MAESRALFRPTFEATLENQKKLFELVDNLIIENRRIKPEERLDTLNLFSRATLGTGITIPISLDGGSMIFAFMDKDTKVENAEELFSYSVYFDGNLKRGNEVIPIRELWKHIRALLLKIRPLAISKALSISAERVESPDRRERGKEPTWI